MSEQTTTEPSADAATEDGLIRVEGPFIVVKDLAERLDVKANQLIAELMARNVFATINQKIDIKVAAQIADAHGFRVEMDIRDDIPPPAKPKARPEPAATDATPESGQPATTAKKAAAKTKTKAKTASRKTTARKADTVPRPALPTKEKKKKKKKGKKQKADGGAAAARKEGAKPPVVTFLGHVDHGKTTLLDYLRESRVAHGESGGITQHMGAYTIEKSGQEITFLDTPGHAAFSKMRERGAGLTDIAIIVIAADDGIMPQTVEAIETVQEAGVTMMVAINKCDLPAANVDRVKQQLQARSLTPEDWGGEIVTCEVSGKTGDGMEELLELILLQAEVLELEADPDAQGRGIVIEGELEPGRGPTATILVTHGTIKVGDGAVCGVQWGRIRSLIGDRGEPVKSAGPAHAVKVLGLSGVPRAGEEVVIEKNDRAARKIAEARAEEHRQETLKAPEKPLSLEDLLASKEAEEKHELNLVVKADVQGSVEAIVDAINEIPSDKVNAKLVDASVGKVSENDVVLASASDARILAFHTAVDPKAVKAAKREDVEIREYAVIYELIDDVTEALVELLDPEVRETVVGKAEIRQVFKLNKAPSVAGCVVVQGRVPANAFARVLRKKDVVYQGRIRTLRRFKDDAKEVGNGQECGIGLEKFDGFSEGDVIEAFTIEKVAQEL